LWKVEDMGKSGGPVTLCITSGKGGVGKTSVTVNLAYALARSGQRVLIVDGDLGLANVDVLLRLSVGKTLRDILDTNSDPLEAVVYVEPNLGILPANSGVPEMVTLGPDEQAQLGDVLDAISEHFDFVLVDTAAGIGPSVLWFNNFAQYSIVVVTPDPTSMTDAYALIKIMARDYDRDRFYLLMNSVGNALEGRQIYDNLQKVAQKFLNIHLQYLGIVPEDKAVIRGVREQVPFIRQSPQSEAARAVYALAELIRMLKNG
jgi:flagellar biosynthesis protein FlhG